MSIGPTQVYRAWVDSPNFSFEAYADSPGAAKSAVISGLREHAEETGARQSWLTDAIADVQVAVRVFHACYRDGRRIWPKIG